MRFIELFCGIGGFRRGLETANLESSHRSTQPQSEDCQAGRQWSLGKRELLLRVGSSTTFRCVWANDNDKYACQIYRKHFGDKELIEGDIRAVNVDTILDFDLLTAGFPCQSFSVAGKRKGFADTRGTLFHEICRVAQAKRPPLLLLENVKGLLSHDEGLTYQIILESLAELGYWCEWQVLNSKHYGVPQNRERIFIIGHLTGTGGREVFPILSDGEKNVSSYETEPRGGKGIWNGDSFKERNRIDITGEGQGNRGTGDSGGSENLIADFNQDGNTYMKDHSSSLRSPKASQSNLLLKHTRIRRLTPVECERLQGFPDGWTEGISDTQRYKCLGNAVTVNVIEALGRAIKTAIEVK